MFLPSNWLIGLAHVSSVLLLGMTTVILGGYATGGGHGGWLGTPIPMALETAIGFLLVGLALLALTTVLDYHLKHCHCRPTKIRPVHEGSSTGSTHGT